MKGFEFPLRFAGGKVATLTDGPKLKSNLRALLVTSIGERTFAPGVGTLAAVSVFQDVGSATCAVLAHEFAKAAAIWEPRVTVRQVKCTPSDGKIATVIEYTINDGSRASEVAAFDIRGQK